MRRTRDAEYPQTSGKQENSQTKWILREQIKLTDDKINCKTSITGKKNKCILIPKDNFRTWLPKKNIVMQNKRTTKGFSISERWTDNGRNETAAQRYIDSSHVMEKWKWNETENENEMSRWNKMKNENEKWNEHKMKDENVSKRNWRSRWRSRRTSKNRNETETNIETENEKWKRRSNEDQTILKMKVKQTQRMK